MAPALSIPQLHKCQAPIDSRLPIRDNAQPREWELGVDHLRDSRALRSCAVIRDSAVASSRPQNVKRNPICPTLCSGCWKSPAKRDGCMKLALGAPPTRRTVWITFETVRSKLAGLIAL